MSSTLGLKTSQKKNKKIIMRFELELPTAIPCKFLITSKAEDKLENKREISKFIVLTPTHYNSLLHSRYEYPDTPSIE